ncbi:MAG: hypothetical protein WD534_10450 [Phycisphaeraceae bacterium]
MSAKRWLTSTVIVAVLGMQASTFITGTWAWPFMAYCMYAQPRYGASAITTQVVAVFGDGRELVVDSNTAGLPWHAWHKQYERPMMDGDEQAANDAAARIASLHGGVVQTLRLTVTRHRITDEEGITVTPRDVTFVPQGEVFVHVQP